MRKPIFLVTLLRIGLYLGLYLGFWATPAHAGYRYRYQVTVDHTQAGSSDSANFPILVYISSNNDFKTTVNGGYIQHTTTLNGQTVPADLIVTTDNACHNQVTAWEVASYSASGGTVELWVNQGTLSHTVNTVFYICIGNSAVTTYQCTATSVWNYAGVWHYPNGSTLTAKDSTSNGINGTLSGTTVPSAVAGSIDGAGSYDGSTGYVTYGSGLAAASSTYSVSFWLYPEAAGNYPMIVSRAVGSSGTHQDWEIAWGVGGNQKPYMAYDGQGTPNIVAASAVSLNTWTQIAFVCDGTNIYVYLNGSQNNSAALSAWQSGNGVVHTGSRATDGYFGTDQMYLDELRVTTSALSAAWVTAEYNMEKPSQTMVTLGSRVALGGPRGSQIMELENGVFTRGLR